MESTIGCQNSFARLDSRINFQNIKMKASLAPSVTDPKKLWKKLRTRCCFSHILAPLSSSPWTTVKNYIKNIKTVTAADDAFVFVSERNGNGAKTRFFSCCIINRYRHLIFRILQRSRLTRKEKKIENILEW